MLFFMLLALLRAMAVRTAAVAVKGGWVRIG